MVGCDSMIKQFILRGFHWHLLVTRGDSFIRNLIKSQSFRTLVLSGLMHCVFPQSMLRPCDSARPAECFIMRLGIKTDSGCHRLTIKQLLYIYKATNVASSRTSSALALASRCACRTWCQMVNQRNASRPGSHPTQEDAASLWPSSESLGAGE